MASTTSPTYTFVPIASELNNLSTKEHTDQLVQYNLDKNLLITRFRYSGPFNKNSQSDFECVLGDLLMSAGVLGSLELFGTPEIPLHYDVEPLNLTVLNTDFFDKLTGSGIVGYSGKIKGCFDEIFEGITVGDSLREMLLNPDSEFTDVFNADEKRELIFQLFRMFAVGGALCQADTDIDRYIAITKALYKDIVTIYRDSKTDEVTLSGRAYKLTKVNGLNLFPGTSSEDNSANVFIILIDPAKKIITAVKNTFRSFW